MKSVGSRLARAVQRVFSRTGPVLSGRHHVRPLRTPLEARRAIAYVLLSAQALEAAHRHERAGAARRSLLRLLVRRLLAREPPGAQAPGPRDVAPPRTWLLPRGWRRRRLIDPAETPG